MRRRGGFVGQARDYGSGQGIFNLQDVRDAPRDPHFASVQLLLHCDGADGSIVFPDHSAAARTVTANGNAQVDTAQSKFGGASARFDGNGDYLQLPSNAALTPAADFTVEFWLRANSWAASKVLVYGSGNFSIESNGTNLLVWDGINRILGALPATGAWHHLALVRSGTSLQAWLNGATYGSSWTNNSTTAFSISGGRLGQHGTAGAATSFDGWIDEFRFTVGVARYTAAFTPPEAPFPNL